MYCLSPPMTEPPEGKSTLYSVSMSLNARSFFSPSKVVSIGKIPHLPYLVEFHHCVDIFDGNSSNINHIRLDSGMNSSQKSELLTSCDGVCRGHGDDIMLSVSVSQEAGAVTCAWLY